jgi:hypothetical protein
MLIDNTISIVGFNLQQNKIVNIQLKKKRRKITNTFSLVWPQYPQKNIDSCYRDKTSLKTKSKGRKGKRRNKMEALNV